MNEYVITLHWDDEVSVWIAESEDIPGLILESSSFDELVNRVKIAVPELLEICGMNHTQLKLRFKAEQLAVVALADARFGVAWLRSTPYVANVTLRTQPCLGLLSF